MVYSADHLQSWSVGYNAWSYIMMSETHNAKLTTHIALILCGSAMCVWYCGLLQISVFILKAYFSVQAIFSVSLSITQLEKQMY